MGKADHCTRVGGASPGPSERLLAAGAMPVLPGRGEESVTGQEGPRAPEWGFLLARQSDTRPSTPTPH